MKKHKHSLFATLLFLFSLTAHTQIITTVAGGDTVLGDGSPATACELYHPESLVFDASGNYYIADRDEHRVRMVDTNGIITTIAGTGFPGFSGINGPATAAEINTPFGIAVDMAGNVCFSDPDNNRIFKIADGMLTLIAGTGIAGYNGDKIQATAAKLDGPGGIAIDKAGNIYFADALNYRIRKIDTAGIITTVAGNGSGAYNGDEIPATNAQLNQPNYAALDNTGNMYIADVYNNRIRKVDTLGIIHTLAGNDTMGYSGDNGPATNAQLNRPVGVYADNIGNIYIGDTYNNVVRKINAGGIITTIAGNGRLGYSGDGGEAIAAELFYPCGMAMDTSYNLFFADQGNGRIRKITSTVHVPIINVPHENLVIYPNPCNGSFFINIASGNDELLHVAITNTLGEIIKNLSLPTNEAVNVHLDERAGVYFIIASSQEGTLSAKLVVSP